MILSYTELYTEVANKMIRPVPTQHINASSIDVTLSNRLLVEATPPGQHKAVVLRERHPLDFAELTLVAPGQVFWLMPGQFILAATAEQFFLPLNISAEFRLKSSAARMGLSHALAVWADPGWNGSALTLELHNISQCHAVGLQAGDRIGQMIFHKHAPVPYEASYAVRGRYNQDPGVQAAKPDPARVNTDGLH